MQGSVRGYITFFNRIYFLHMKMAKVVKIRCFAHKPEFHSLTLQHSVEPSLGRCRLQPLDGRTCW